MPIFMKKIKDGKEVLSEIVKHNKKLSISNKVDLRHARIFMGKDYEKLQKGEELVDSEKEKKETEIKVEKEIELEKIKKEIATLKTALKTEKDKKKIKALEVEIKAREELLK